MPVVKRMKAVRVAAALALGFACNQVTLLGTANAAGATGAPAAECQGWISCGAKPGGATAATPAPVPKPAPVPAAQPKALPAAAAVPVAAPPAQATVPQRAAASVPPPAAATKAAPPAKPTEPPASRIGFYLGVEVGGAPVADLTTKVADSYEQAYGATGTVGQDLLATGGRLFLGWEITENFSWEMGLTALSANLTVEGDIAGDSFKDTYDSSWRIIDYTLLLRPDASSGLHGFFVRLGSHVTTNTLKNRWAGEAWAEEGSETKTKDKFGFLLGLGYDLALGQRKAHVLRFSYTHYDNVPDLSDDLEVGKGFLEDNTLDVFKVGYLYRF